MNAVRFALQFDNRCSVHHSIQQGHRQRRIAEIIGTGFEVDVGHQGRAGSLASCVDDFVPQAGSLGTKAAFNAVQAELINDQQVEAGIEADAVVDRLVGQGGGQIFQESTAGRVKDTVAENASDLADVLNQPAFAQARLADEDDDLAATDEVS